ncbi:hypothetical protein TNCV_506331 [Trichonephila clavipes]|nr:hypothetical protein TNCV_506331 [Trichonephila clavipes]
MARLLENWSRLEVGDMIRFLRAKNVSASDIYSQIVEVYGEEANRRYVTKWCRLFNQACNVSKTPNVRSCRPSSSRTEINMA